MKKCNPKNERIKRAHFEWQKEANHKSQSTIDNIRKAIDKYERYTSYQDFRTFNKDKAKAFKKHLTQAKTTRTKEFLSKQSILSTLRHIKSFFKWLAYEKGYKRSIDIREIEFLNPSESDIRITQGKRRKRVPTIEQIKKTIQSMPSDNDIELRNRALIAFTLVSGARDSAIASLRLKHIKIDEELVEQLPPEVKTKFSKTIYTYFFPIGDDIKQIVTDWVNYLFKIKLFNADDPLFPRTKLILDENNFFKAGGIEPIFWRSTNQINKIFKNAFENAGIEYFNPHSFRKTLARVGEQMCKTPEEFKAWSQNFGHDKVLTTFTSYGYIDEHNQGKIIKGLSSNKSNETSEEINTITKEFLKVVNKQKGRTH